MVSGPWGASHGPTSATSTISPTITRPSAPCGVRTRRFASSAILDPLVDPGVADVCQEVHDRVGRRHDQRAGLDGGQVARLDGDDQLAAKPGQGEDLLD